jgi:hypothetical protein
MESLINLLRNINEPFGNDNTYIILTNKLQESINKLKRNISDEELNIINKKYKNIKIKTDALIANDNLKNLFDYYQIPNINYFLKNRILVNLIIKFLLLKKKYDTHKHLNNALDNLMITSNPLNTSVPPFVPGNPLNTSAHIPSFVSSQSSNVYSASSRSSQVLPPSFASSQSSNEPLSSLASSQSSNVYSASSRSSQVLPPSFASSQSSNEPLSSLASSQSSNVPAFSISGADGPNQNDINQTFYYYKYDTITNRYSFINDKKDIVIVFGDLGWEIKKKDILRGFAKNLCFTGIKQQGITPDICSQTEWNLFEGIVNGIPSFKKVKLTFKKLGPPPLNLSTLPSSQSSQASSQTSQASNPLSVKENEPDWEQIDVPFQGERQRRLPIFEQLAEEKPVPQSSVVPSQVPPSSQDASTSSTASSAYVQPTNYIPSFIQPGSSFSPNAIPSLSQPVGQTSSSSQSNPSVQPANYMPSFIQPGSSFSPNAIPSLSQPVGQTSSAPDRLNETVTNRFPKNLQLTEHPTIPGLFLQPDLANASSSSNQPVPIQDEEQRKKSTSQLLQFTREDADRLVGAPEFVPPQKAGNNDKHFKKYLKYKSKYLKYNN